MHVRLGDVDLWLLEDGHIRLDGGAMFGVVPRILWERVAPPDARHRIRLALRCLLIRAGGKHVLVDTGVGDRRAAAWCETYGVERPRGLVAELAAVGVEPRDIDVVVNSHLHFDHAGGNTRRDGDRLVPAYPNARYLCQAGHWQEALHGNERNRRSFEPEDFLPLAGAGQLDLVEGDVEVAPGVRIHLTPGHCHHHQSVLVTSGGRSAMFLGDLVPTAAHAPLPWVMGFDVDPLRTVETRRRIYREAIDQRWLLMLDHDPELACGRLEARGDRYTIVPAE